MNFAKKKAVLLFEYKQLVYRPRHPTYSCTEPNSAQLSTFQPVASQPLCVTNTCRAIFN